jgi:hypothetical protein
MAPIGNHTAGDADVADKQHHDDGRRPVYKGEQQERFSASDETRSSDPYPLVYSRDPWDERRWNRLTSLGPSIHRVGRMQVLITWAVLGGGALLIVLAIIAQTSAAHVN